MKKQVILTITGRVQGVFYRSETQKTARELELHGYVKNNADGSVTVIANGEEDKLKRLIAWCKKGPDGALVDNIEIQYRPLGKDVFGGFEMR